jgi:hypothetical protein
VAHFERPRVTRLAERADWGARHDFARLAYDGRLWVFGGWRDRSTNAPQ